GPCEIDVRIEFQSDSVEPDGFLLVAQFSQVGPDIGVIDCRAWIQLYNPFKRSDRFIMFLQFEIAEPSQVVDFFEFGVGLFSKTERIQSFFVSSQLLEAGGDVHVDAADFTRIRGLAESTLEKRQSSLRVPVQFEAVG